MNAPIARYWVAAAESGYAEPRDWQDWADRIILAMPTPPAWVLDLATATDAAQVRTALIDRLVTAEWNARESLDDSVIGYLWLRFVRGKLSLNECMRLAGMRADCGDGDVGCESFYDLLSRLDAGEEYERVVADAQRLMAPLVAHAEQQWEMLARVESI